ncbi:MAG TPA: hypothetical protein ENN89_05640 [Synergistetes bacterium]|nr:hypothetical protein [Synergistota bacterium]
MLYFQFLALVFGTVMLTLAPFMVLRGERWVELFRDIMYPEKQPVWVWVSGAATVILVLLTWYVELTTRVPYSWIMTIFISLGIPKSYLLTFQYPRTRNFVFSLMERGRIFSLGLAGIIYLTGFLIVCLGIFAF